ncbi:FKBP-type peptidyl-prolyl cis-trans isomerase [uncultured Mucilaginibacter sp.]|uniref:FKBP-type peptidyl-prolyl cis-trans isomerase n=1 Tax=uncultured Mucilaginibacter sp. TaxID=797541 RepID=UPI002636850C|nr:FKBP-type peptidyl-prolyl cis-trans isomerase [uncultured Mucilaginibacter sp.]
MKQLAFAFLSVLALAMFSCKKEYDQIQTVDNNTIQSYISANGLKMMPGDSGIYYQIIKPGDTGNPITDSDVIFYAYSVKTLDGKVVSTDTVLNRVSNYAGLNLFNYRYYSTTTMAPTTAFFPLPVGLQFSIKKYLQKRNGIIRMLIPSSQAYGLAGYTFPDLRVKIPGNESLDYTVYLYNVDSQLAYDTVQIRNYIKNNNLTGFQKTPSGLYYKIVDPGSGTDQIYSTSTVTITYTKRLLLSGIVTENKSLDAAALGGYIAGWQEGLQKINSGGKIRLLVPSGLAYGAIPTSTVEGQSTYNVPPNSIMDYDINVTAVTN